MCPVVVSCRYFSLLTGRTTKNQLEFELTEEYNPVRFIASYYKTKTATEKLASRLLDGKQPGGGAGFITNHFKNGETVDWPAMAINVIGHAYRTGVASEERWTDVLLAALRETIPDSGKDDVERYFVNRGN